MLKATLRDSVLLAALLAVPFAAQAVEIVQGPTLTMNPTGFTPLAGVVELETDTVVQVQLTISGGGDLWTVSFPDAGMLHDLPVLGLEPDRTYTVDVELIPGGPAGSVLATTLPLPADFPVVVAQTSSPLSMEPGFTLIDCFRRSPGDMRPTYTTIVNAAGDVVWYSTLCSAAFRQLVNGNLMYRDRDEIVEIDMLGHEKRRLALNDPGVRLHHDHFRTPMGTYLSLSRKSVLVPDFPTSETDPAAPGADASVADEPVVEFLPDGSLRGEWLFTELIDPTRIGYDSLNPRTEGYDWAHANGVIYDPGDDTIVASLRHQDAVIKFSRATGELVWILSPHDNWSPEFQPFLLQPVGSPFRWPYHPHAPMLTGDGNVMLFDNGNHRASPFDGTPPTADSANFSRGVEYEITEGSMHVRQVWEYGENVAEQLYSGFLCDADWLDTTGNVLMTFGSVSYVDGVSSTDLGLGPFHTRIVEATDDPVPVTVFELRIHDAAGGAITVYRSERIPGLYPQQYVKAPNGVGRTVLASKASGATSLTWTASPVDAEHDAADYYVVYASSAPGSGFTMLDTSVSPDATPAGGAGTQFFKIVAANSAGTSGDEPSP